MIAAWVELLNLEGLCEFAFAFWYSYQFFVVLPDTWILYCFPFALCIRSCMVGFISICNDDLLTMKSCLDLPALWALNCMPIIGMVWSLRSYYSWEVCSFVCFVVLLLFNSSQQLDTFWWSAGCDCFFPFSYLPWCSHIIQNSIMHLWLF